MRDRLTQHNTVTGVSIRKSVLCENDVGHMNQCVTEDVVWVDRQTDPYSIA